MNEPVLRLTAIIFPGDSPKTFIGAIKEISGIVVQGDSEDEVYRELMEGTRHMLEYKHGEALELLRRQINEEYEPSEQIGFALRRERVEAPVE